MSEWVMTVSVCMCTLQCFYAVCVCRCSLLYKVEDLDGVGHPEEDGLQVWDQVWDTEQRQGGRVLATWTHTGTHTKTKDTWTKCRGLNSEVEILTHLRKTVLEHTCSLSVLKAILTAELASEPALLSSPARWIHTHTHIRTHTHACIHTQTN